MGLMGVPVHPEPLDRPCHYGSGLEFKNCHGANG